MLPPGTSHLKQSEHFQQLDPPPPPPRVEAAAGGGGVMETVSVPAAVVDVGDVCEPRQ